MFAFGSRSARIVRLAERTRTVAGGLCGCAAISPDPLSDMKERGEIDMVSRALATLELMTPRRRAVGIPGGTPRRSCRTVHRHRVLAAAVFRELLG
jgi:hypothetical protein